MRQLINILSFMILGFIFGALSVPIMKFDVPFGLAFLFVGGAVSENLSNLFVKFYDKCKDGSDEKKVKVIEITDVEIMLDALTDKMKSIETATDTPSDVKLRKLAQLIYLKEKLCQ